MTSAAPSGSCTDPSRRTPQRSRAGRPPSPRAPEPPKDHTYDSRTNTPDPTPTTPTSDHRHTRQSERHEAGQQVRGTAELHTTVTSTKESGTLVAYLYDVGPLGLGKLVSHAPYTFHGKEPGRPFAVDLELFSTAYDVPAGHRLAVVVDTVDPLYIEHNPSGAQLTFSSPAADPSYLSVPLRQE
ncbi:CocE/NonD family hydrolase C-terminal non-catalytic domain-containing protein [Streptomyces sp. NPDC054802]